jgi:hypothetical protein
MAIATCWEYLKCGKEDACPAYPERGWECWNVESTLCRGTRQGDYDAKITGCRQTCTYYNGVMDGSIKPV